MYGNSVYNVRHEYEQTKKSIIRKFIKLAIVISIMVVISRFSNVFSSYLTINTVSFMDLNASTGHTISIFAVLKKNSVIQAITIFVTSLFSLIIRFFDELKELVSSLFQHFRK